MKIIDVAKTFGAGTFSHGKNYALILTKNGLGYILDDFVRNSSCCPKLDPGFIDSALRTEDPGLNPARV
jgi:hypothetical protein